MPSWFPVWTVGWPRIIAKTAVNLSTRPCGFTWAISAAYLSQAILTAIQGTLDDNNNRLCRILFKCAVELNMLCHTIAAHFRTDPIHTRELRAYAVDEVKRTNGQVSFESAVRQQRRIKYEPDEEMGGL